MAQKEFSVVGKRITRIDAYERVTGQAQYAGDIQLAGMLYARLLRSPHPHARVVSIDTSRAEKLPGVKAVIHHQNAQVPWASGGHTHRRYIFNNPVRFVGDAVAAVAATDRHIAEEALGLIEVKYEKLPHVLDPNEALKPGAPKISTDGNLSVGKGNFSAPIAEQWGDLEKGFKEADRIFEDTYISKHVNNAQLEPRASVAKWEGGKLTVWASTQGVSNARTDIAKDLGLPLSKVRVICKYMGAGFGNKNQAQDYDLMAAVLAKVTGQPVKVEFTREDDFIGMHGRWASEQHYKIGVKRDGTITAVELDAVTNVGAYRKQSGNLSGTDFYQIPNFKKVVKPVHTNTVVGANYRAPAYPQSVFGFASFLDQIAHEMGINPLEMFLKNRVRLYANKTPFTSNFLEECAVEGAKKVGWKEKWHKAGAAAGPKKHGIGMALGGYPFRPGLGAAAIRVNPDGTAHVLVGVTDIGTGAKTTMAIIAAEALGIPLNQIQLTNGDTDVTPYSVGESGSRTTPFTGPAVIAAAEDVRKLIFNVAAPQLKAKAEDLDLRDGKVFVKSNPSQSLPLGRAVARSGELIGRATTNPTFKGLAGKSFAAHFAEVEVDSRTGHVKITRYVAVHDSGTIINRLAAESQIKGGVVQGIGMALAEELLIDRFTAIPLNPSYRDAKVPTHLEVPEIEVVFIEHPDPYGPFGGKVVGEPPITPAVATVANAIFNATGKRIKELPITPDKILRAAQV
ncbi:MAG: xanthine dehydrogenase family protein molybdopterin-binding subunit [Deltaproteobacteria bacterium]|nr:xanthine dehydrogenase family protein molybdopterin-binding subunit [Deltaproteobacteria bacterium]